ncbi:uncharacterized protein LOC111089720 [Limulus polyphemus]|uniref:Uncharacterized protein LOC111089720 n=1 Tax=Limulus polyphemus TaxID=6850 RepID=A0ABM1TR98_LIMPO|nr:uncharacterized protein LOC111089720 [Limulus polyphemus]
MYDLFYFSPEPNLEEKALSPPRQSFCKEGQLPRSLRIISSCYPHARPGTNCSVKCHDHMYLQGDNTVQCLSSTEWSSYPFCVEQLPALMNTVHCVEEELPPELILEKSCTKEVTKTCNVTCPEDKVLIGDSTIMCLSTGRWSSIPFCDNRCDEDARYFSGKCYKLMWKTRGIMAHWKCQTLNMEPLLIEDQLVFNFIVDYLNDMNEECLWTSINDIGEEQTWKDGMGKPVNFFNWYPGEPDTGYYGKNRDCVAMPKWRNYQYSDYPCDKSSCRFICQYHARCSVSNDFMWSRDQGVKKTQKMVTLRDLQIRSVSAIRCPFSSLPSELFISSNCIEHPDVICDIECPEGGVLEGPEVIICLPSGQWSAIPRCVPKLEDQKEVITDTQTNCKEIQLPRSVKLNEDCAIETKQGIKCQLQCAKNLILQGNNEVTCLPNGIWSSKPYCVRDIQRDPTKVLCTEEELPPEVDLEDICPMAVNSECKVSCHESKFLVGPSSIKCLPSGHWSATPYCDERCSGAAWYYKGKCYKLMWESLGMTAQWKCQVLNMEPLVINDEDVYKFIVDRLTNIKEECLWTTLNDQQEELVFRDATGNIAKFINWYPGEPDTGEFGYDRDCVLLPKWRNYQYSDYRCDDNWCKFMCQYNATNVS